MKKLINRCLCLLLSGLIASLFVPLSSDSTPDVNKVGGMNQCTECHEEIVPDFYDSIHGKKGFGSNSVNACEVCHGPGKEHIEEGGDLSKIISFKNLSIIEKNSTCLKCHKNGENMFWEGSSHDSGSMDCLSCHRIHTPAVEKSLLVSVTEKDLCFSCHKQKRAQSLRTSHHPIREGKITCSDCHNPHGSSGDKLISNVSINKKCFECHAEKRGPFLWDHEPVREECTICHDPHGSNHSKLLVSKRPYLCQRCHSETEHPGRLYDGKRIRSNKVFNRSCSNCHANIHGSNHPSGKSFIR